MTTVILTGTISPPQDARELSHINIEQRLQDYRNSLAYHIGLLKEGVLNRIVFVDNSNYGVDELQALVEAQGVTNQVMLLSYDGNNQGGSQTRFFGECKLLRHVLQVFPELVSQKDMMWKVTGRYTVRNLAEIIRNVPDGCDLALHCRNYPSEYVDFGLVGFKSTASIEFFDRILARENIHLSDERIVRDMINEGALDDMEVLCRLGEPPDFMGVRGSDSSSYDGWKYRTKYYIRKIASRVIPSLWV